MTRNWCNFFLSGRALSALVILAAAPLALAEPVPPTVRISNGTTSVEIPSDAFVFDPETNLFASEGTISAPGDFQFAWDLTANPDPFIIGTISVLNFSTMPSNFQLTYVQPATPTLAAPTTANGSIEIGVQNFNGDATAVLTTAGATPIYQALIDGSLQTTLLNTANLVATGPLAIANTSASFGPIFGGPAVNTDIGIEVNFNVTGGDLVSGSVFYNVVPEPSSLAALTGGILSILGLAWVRRRG